MSPGPAPLFTAQAGGNLTGAGLTGSVRWVSSDASSAPDWQHCTIKDSDPYARATVTHPARVSRIGQPNDHLSGPGAPPARPAGPAPPLPTGLVADGYEFALRAVIR